MAVVDKVVSRFVNIHAVDLEADSTDGDILEVLTFALARQSLPDLTEESQLQRGGTFPDEQLATIEEASSAINHRLQEQAQKLRSKYCNAKTLTKRQSD